MSVTPTKTKLNQVGRESGINMDSSENSITGNASEPSRRATASSESNASSQTNTSSETNASSETNTSSETNAPGAGSQLPPGVPPEAVPFLMGIGYFEPDRLKRGDDSPRMTLATLDGGAMIDLGNPGVSQPVVLIFGSYT